MPNFPYFCPWQATSLLDKVPRNGDQCVMSELVFPSYDLLLASFLTCLMIREMLIVLLPNHLAGPGGKFIDTGPE